MAGDFLRALIAAVPYKIHTVLTDNGTHFTIPPSTAPAIKAAIERGELVGPFFDSPVREHDIEHRLTKPRHPWTNGQVERMNRTLKDATVKRYTTTPMTSCGASGRLLSAYNFARRLKTLKGLTPYEFICKFWTTEPKRFRLDPLHQMPGLLYSAV